MAKSRTQKNKFEDYKYRFKEKRIMWNGHVKFRRKANKLSTQRVNMIILSGSNDNGKT